MKLLERLKTQAGMTLVEMMVGAAIALLALFAVVDLEFTGWKLFRSDGDRFSKQAGSALALDRFLMEARLGVAASVPDPRRVVLTLPTGTVTYSFNPATAELLRTQGGQSRAVAREITDMTFAMENGGRTVRVEVTATLQSGSPYRNVSRATLRLAP